MVELPLRHPALFKAIGVKVRNLWICSGGDITQPYWSSAVGGILFNLTGHLQFGVYCPTLLVVCSGGDIIQCYWSSAVRDIIQPYWSSELGGILSNLTHLQWGLLSKLTGDLQWGILSNLTGHLQWGDLSNLTSEL